MKFSKVIKSEHNIENAYQQLKNTMKALKVLQNADLVSEEHCNELIMQLEDLITMLQVPVLKKTKSKTASNYVSKQALEQAINEYVETAEVNDILRQFKSEYIGQGWGYKKDGKWESFANDEVIYIPECGYGSEDVAEGSATCMSDYPIWPDYIYTKQDFINLVGNDRARQLFEDVDWQTPEILSQEYDWQTDYNEVGRNAPEGFEPKYDENGAYIAENNND